MAEQKEKQKEKTPQEVEAEKQAALAKASEVAKKNLASKLWDYATPELLTYKGYGQLADAGQAFYLKAISEPPEKDIYQQLFLPQLVSKGGAITSQYIQATSHAILQESLAGVKVADALKYAGYTGAIKNEYMNKYVAELSQEELGTIIGSAMQYQTDEIAKKVLGFRQKEISKSLEDLVAPPKEDPNKKDPK